MTYYILKVAVSAVVTVHADHVVAVRKPDPRTAVRSAEGGCLQRTYPGDVPGADLVEDVSDPLPCRTELRGRTRLWIALGLVMEPEEETMVESADRMGLRSDVIVERAGCDQTGRNVRLKSGNRPRPIVSPYMRSARCPMLWNVPPQNRAGS